MMGPTHAATGALAGAGVALYLETHHALDVAIPVLIATVWVTAGAAILPDLDHPQATIARTWGGVSKMLSKVVNRFSAGFVNATGNRKDEHCSNGHRMFTHTLLFAVLMTVATYLFVATLGVPAAAGIMYVLVCLGIQTLFRKQARRLGPVLSNILALVLVGVALYTASDMFTPEVLALVVGLGCVVHMLGDLPTEAGIPLFAPFVPVRGKRWGKVRLPSLLRVRVGGGADTVVFGLSVICTLYVMARVVIH